MKSKTVKFNVCSAIGLFGLIIMCSGQQASSLTSVKPDTTLLKRNSTKMSLPFQGEWSVLWGGDTQEQNYHVAFRFAKNAFDFVMTDKQNKLYSGNGEGNEDYYAFGKPILAPCDGTVVFSQDTIHDNKPGKLNPDFFRGNCVMLKTENEEYLEFAHLKYKTVVLKKGDAVKRGQVLGLCGNSGNSYHPHLHFHIEDKESMREATGIKCYFDSILVNGKVTNDYSPVKGDKIENKKDKDAYLK